MRSCRLQIAVLIFVATWFGLVLPGHQRGLIKVPGAEATASADGGCCASRCEPTGEPAPGGDAPRPAKDPTRHCAVCTIIAMMLEVAVYQPPPTLHTLAAIIDPPAPHAIVGVEPQRVLSDRGPPAPLVA